MARSIWKSTMWLSLWVGLLVLQAGQAATHGHGKGDGASLLPECQGSTALPSPNCGQTPTPAFDRQGRLWLAFARQGHVYLTHSDDLGSSFAPPRAVNRIPEAVSSDGENRPKLAIGKQGEIYLSWTVKIPGRYAGNIRFTRSLDGGETFSKPLTVNDDRAPISHRFDAMILDAEGRIYLVWIDKRDLAAAKKAGQEYAGAAIYYALSDDLGESFAFNRKLADHSCECCRIALDLDGDDRVVALWRHVYPVNIRDHAIARLGPDSQTIRGLPVRATDDGWRIDGCPHHGPDLSVDTQQQAHLVWFTQGTKNKGLMYGRFDLRKQTLENQYAIDPTGAASRPQVLVVGDRLYTAWKSFDGNQTKLLASVSFDQGERWSDPYALAQTTDGSDHPQLIARDAQVFVSWHTLAEGYRLLPIQAADAGVRHVE
ncbi:MAG: sialidase family protein [Gammaproteobacteria bacterium]|nr:sialidase family protein [Gammaproteobacteria bacterium]